MTEKIKAGSWVQIHQVVLPAGERAPQVPEDTQLVPLELKVNGFLLQDTVDGQEAEVETLTGRKLKGTLIDAAPSYEHKFGRPVPELLKIGRELKTILQDEEV